ncbi:MAG: PLP-dependent aminotransferase family protein [Legionellaceae bacterium]|nr:PLP-dependent aminotransferase family protein [Legionellaceae bacterium]
MSQINRDDFILPSWVNKNEPSTMENLLASTYNSSFISFALGLPALEFFPMTHFQQAIQEILTSGYSILQYTPPLDELKTRIVELMTKRGVSCTPNQILLTSGAQQGISLLTRLLLEQHSIVITEELAYPGLLQALMPFSPEILTVPTNPKTGLCVEAVEAILKKGIRPAFLYLVTDGGNPHAVSLSLEKRLALAAIANQYGMPIIEDDPYGFLSYQTPINPLKTYANDWVFYVGSFSKIAAPALRVGWIVASECLIPKLASLKECSDINMSTLMQHTVNILLRDKIIDNHITVLCQHYLQRRNQMVSSLTSHFPHEVTFHVPESGVFLWVDFEKSINTSLLLQEAIKHHVVFIPSESFASTKQIQIYNGMRLNFSYANETTIEEGIKRLALSFKKQILSKIY